MWRDPHPHLVASWAQGGCSASWGSPPCCLAPAGLLGLFPPSGPRTVSKRRSHLHPRLSLGGLSLAIEGPSKAEISCTDNQDGTCSVSYLPVLPGDYSILVKYNEQHIPGSPFTARVTGG